MSARTLAKTAGLLILLIAAAGCPDGDSRNNPGVGSFESTSSLSRNPAGKDLTLLHGDSRFQTDSLPDRIRRLNREIARGEGVYTREELELLERKLADCAEQSRVLQSP